LPAPLCGHLLWSPSLDAWNHTLLPQLYLSSLWGQHLLNSPYLAQCVAQSMPFRILLDY
jgi:hypothetical protein